MAEPVGYKITGTITGVKGKCHWGHKLGDKIELGAHETGGLCGFLYHAVFPYVVMLQFGGGFPREWGNPDVVTIECMDRANAVEIELRREK